MSDTINGIVDAVSMVYGNEYEKYIGEIQEQLNKPCFLIKPIKSSQDHHMQNRYIRTETFDISYYSNEIAHTYEYMGVIDNLFNILEYIYIGESLTRGTEMSSEIVEGVLHFSVTYKVFVIKSVDDEENMEAFSAKVRLKDK